LERSTSVLAFARSRRLTLTCSPALAAKDRAVYRRACLQGCVHGHACFAKFFSPLHVTLFSPIHCETIRRQGHELVCNTIRRQGHELVCLMQWSLASSGFAVR
jgi:hypothetical protein